MGIKEDADTARGSENGSDRILRIFGRPYFLSLTIGVPFCIFKLLFGITALRVGLDTNSFLVAFGGIVIAWAPHRMAMRT